MIVVDLKKEKEIQYRNKENQIDLITTGINRFYFDEEKNDDYWFKRFKL